jgi:hypothetical protein
MYALIPGSQYIVQLPKGQQELPEADYHILEAAAAVQENRR